MHSHHTFAAQLEACRCRGGAGWWRFRPCPDSPAAGERVCCRKPFESGELLLASSRYPVQTFGNRAIWRVLAAPAEAASRYLASRAIGGRAGSPPVRWKAPQRRTAHRHAYTTEWVMVPEQTPAAMPPGTATLITGVQVAELSPVI